jgi:hypothetical protein
VLSTGCTLCFISLDPAQVTGVVEFNLFKTAMRLIEPPGSHFQCLPVSIRDEPKILDSIEPLGAIELNVR